MKKLLFVLITLFCFFLIGCNEKQNNMSADSKVDLESKQNLLETNREALTDVDDQGAKRNENGDYSNERTNYGMFYSLQEAYQLGILSLDDLKKIIDINHGDTEFNEKIDMKVEQRIKSDYILILLKNYNFEDAKMDDISIIKFYGNYNGAYVISFTDIYSMPIGILEHGFAVTISSDPPRINYFKYFGEYSIVVWREGIYE